MEKKKILVVEDEIKIARFLELELYHEGYEVETTHDGREAFNKILENIFDLVILDLMLPSLSGIEICRRIRQQGIQIPVIMLTAKDDISDKVMGLDIGADDYMTKPFAIEELLARIRVGLRKNNQQQDHKQNIIAIKGVCLNSDERRVMCKGEPVLLTKIEFDLLAYLMCNKNIALSREKIIENIWGYQYMGGTNITDVYVRYLRSKIDQPFEIDLIQTIRGVGYCVHE
jgi:DNA-binding response OmpR family regulator